MFSVGPVECTIYMVCAPAQARLPVHGSMGVVRSITLSKSTVLTPCVKYLSMGRSLWRHCTDAQGQFWLHYRLMTCSVNAFTGFADEPCASKTWCRHMNEWKKNKAQSIKSRRFGKHCLHMSQLFFKHCRFLQRDFGFHNRRGLVAARLGLHQDASLIKPSKLPRSIADVLFQFQWWHLVSVQMMVMMKSSRPHSFTPMFLTYTIPGTHMKMWIRLTDILKTRFVFVLHTFITVNISAI